MTFYLAIPVLTLAALLQNAWLSSLSIFGARPDLMLLLVLCWTLVGGFGEGVIWAFVGGLIIDLLSGGPMGAHMLALIGVAFVGRQSWGEGLGAPLIRTLLLALVASLLYHGVLLAVLTWTGHNVDWTYSFLRVAGPSVALTVVLAPLVRRLMEWTSVRLQLRGQRR